MLKWVLGGKCRYLIKNDVLQFCTARFCLRPYIRILPGSFFSNSQAKARDTIVRKLKLAVHSFAR